MCRPGTLGSFCPTTRLAPLGGDRTAGVFLNSYGSEGADGEESLDEANEDRKLANLNDQDRAREPAPTELPDSVRETCGGRKRDRSDGERLEAADGARQSGIRSRRTACEDGVRVPEEQEQQDEREDHRGRRNDRERKDPTEPGPEECPKSTSHDPSLGRDGRARGDRKGERGPEQEGLQADDVSRCAAVDRVKGGPGQSVQDNSEQDRHSRVAHMHKNSGPRRIVGWFQRTFSSGFANRRPQRNDR